MRVDGARIDGGSVNCRDSRVPAKGIVHNLFLPPTLILSFVLAITALALNAINPGIAAVTGAAAALILLAMLLGWGR